MRKLPGQWTRLIYFKILATAILLRFLNIFSLLENSFEEQMAFHSALKQFVMSIDTNYAKGSTEFFIGFEGSFGNKHVTPRTLTSRFLGNLVCLEGIATKCEPMFMNIIQFIPIVIIHYIFYFLLLVSIIIINGIHVDCRDISTASTRLIIIQFLL